MPKKQTIPTEIQDEVRKLIDEFNRVNLKESTSLLSVFFPKKVKRGYSARFKGKFLYLDRTDRYEPLPICRLTWNGKMDNWDFAIYKYSSGKYDPEEWFFPGEEYVDGTVTGAMKAGMEAYSI
ncbi:MAG: hypothetical protein ACOYYI_13970 [Chloroflexota bacterium]